jgi:hypothetical protein
VRLRDGRRADFSKRAILRPAIGHDSAGGNEERYATGVSPNTLRKLVVNEPTLFQPTAKQMSVTDQSLVRNKAAARSRRRVRR